jgi:hypothetical protein
MSVEHSWKRVSHIKLQKTTKEKDDLKKEQAGIKNNFHGI